MSDMSIWLQRTMLLERVAGVLSYVVPLLFVCAVVKRTQSHKTLKTVLNIYLVILCIMAFFYIPGESSDLHRWLSISNGWLDEGFENFFKTKVTGSASPLAYLMIYACRCTGIDGVLPALCALIFFGNVFYILKDLNTRHGAEFKNVSCLLFFVMSSGAFLEVISGVRCFVAVSIMARCIYDEYMNQKSFVWTIIWGVAASLIHPLALVIFIVRIVLLIFEPSKSFKRKIINWLLVGVTAILSLTYGLPYILAAYKKAGNFASSSGYSYLWEYIIAFIFFLLFVIIIFFTGRNILSFGEKRMRAINLLFVIIELAFCWEYSIFHRTVIFSSLLMLPVIGAAIKEDQGGRINRLVQIVSTVVLLLASVRGNLCGYKFI